MKIKIVSFLSAIFLLCNSGPSKADSPGDTLNEPKIIFKVNTDIVSTYIWRGTVGNSNPNIQPSLGIVSGGFEAGVWGSTDFSGYYKELDPYFTYTIKTFKIGITDYDWIFVNPSYFDYTNSTTDHILEASLSFIGTEKVPLSISINTMFYGADKKWDKSSDGFSNKQNYSTYIELGWSFRCCNVFLGMTPANGYYGAGYGKIDGFAVCNLGFSSVRNIKITPDFQLPLKGTLYLNPQAESIHFVISITI